MVKQFQTPKIIFVQSQRYNGKHYIHGMRYLYWWDITPSHCTLIMTGSKVIFAKRDILEVCLVPPEKLLPLLTAPRQTSRSGGNWGVRLLLEHPNEIAIEPGKHWSWAYLPVHWQSLS